MSGGPEWSREISDFGRKQKSKKKSHHMRDREKDIAGRGNITRRTSVGMEKNV